MKISLGGKRKTNQTTDRFSTPPTLPETFKPYVGIFKKLSSPIKIQNFLDTIPLNWEKQGETYMSVERMLREQKAHCLEGALFAALALWLHGEAPLIMDLKSYTGDDHVVALYKRGGRWGAISKTNHAVLRFRDPVYVTVRELALSYFHEYIDTKSGEKILTSFSKPFDLRKIKYTDTHVRENKRRSISKNAHKNIDRNISPVAEWISGVGDLTWLAEALDESPHEQIYPSVHKKYIRNADHMELKAGNIIEWNKSDIRT
jgi:hypothetical protein